ncbi:MAG: hypothetical protein GC131_02385 [Alphaproteobacteria bacterium]|nr:hypothetical protein [Alphaproteobacteria bacterium]
MTTTSKTKAPHLKTVDPEAIESVMKAGQEAASKQFEGAMKATSEQLEQVSKRLMQSAEQMTSANRETMEACVSAATICAKGCEEISRSLMNWSQASLEQAMATSKQALTVKTLREYVDLQTEFVKTCLDSTLAETSRCSELATRTVNQAIEPVTEKVNAAMERFNQQSKEAAKDAA